MILRLGALVILLDIAVDPFSQQLIQYRQDTVYIQDTQTTVSVAGRYSKGSEFAVQLAGIDPSKGLLHCGMALGNLMTDTILSSCH